MKKILFTFFKTFGHNIQITHETKMTCELFTISNKTPSSSPSSSSSPLLDYVMNGKLKVGEEGAGGWGRWSRV